MPGEPADDWPLSETDDEGVTVPAEPVDDWPVRASDSATPSSPAAPAEAMPVRATVTSVEADEIRRLSAWNGLLLPNLAIGRCLYAKRMSALLELLVGIVRVNVPAVTV